ncbi:MAG: neutral/alkaline non-lysosomal ceramidase N-terminal domain-containing protein, partial [Lentisphaeria bacterium]|nr:neutral/alkaline non-lysosomal ceramidase N-terminal domain-containing protein [Lentisphaeria bacterium]
MFKLGCAEAILEVPLFTELYGYGHYAGRRNVGVWEDLYCRAFSFFDGKKRAVIVYSDICTTDDQFARELRAQIASKLRINPEGIAFVATHTHSGPALSSSSPDTSGIRNAEFESYWKKTAVSVALKAFEDEEEIASADTGKAPLAKAIGTNRVEPEENFTDPSIRWMRFKRPDGSVKLIWHNHGVHGIADNGPNDNLVSSDWMGAANRIIRERKLADYSLFLQGAA